MNCNTTHYRANSSSVPGDPTGPLTEALAQARITVEYLARVDSPDGVVSPGLVIRQEQDTPGGPTMILRYVIGRMSASATLSGAAQPLDGPLTGPDGAASETPAAGDPTVAEVPGPAAGPPPPAAGPAAAVRSAGARTAGAGPTGFPSPRSGLGPFTGLGTGTMPAAPAVTDTATDSGVQAAPALAAPAATVTGEIAPISGTPTALVDVTSVYLIVVAAATVVLLGGTVLRFMGVNLKWTS